MENQKLDELRRQAKERLDTERDDTPENTGDEVRKLLHELRTYQIELELQNDELHRVQEELVETRDQYIDLYDFAPFGYLTLSEKGVIVKANLTLADLLGEERRSLYGQPFTHFIFHKDQDRFYKCFRAFIVSMDRLVFDLRMQRKDGDWFWAKLECVTRTKSEMSGIHIRIALHDITDAKRLEHEIIQTKKLEATALLAGGIAHDFNNLLAVIMGNLDREVLSQVFDPYFTSKNLWNTKGLGLGLTVTYSILKKHGGAIDIASRQDAGTTPCISRRLTGRSSRRNPGPGRLHL